MGRFLIFKKWNICKVINWRSLKCLLVGIRFYVDVNLYSLRCWWLCNHNIFFAFNDRYCLRESIDFMFTYYFRWTFKCWSIECVSSILFIFITGLCYRIRIWSAWLYTKIFHFVKNISFNNDKIDMLYLTNVIFATSITTSASDHSVLSIFTI